MSGIFTPQMVVNDIMNVVDKDTTGYLRLRKFYEDLGYTAPEIRDARFWGGAFNKDSIVDICKNHYEENKEVHKIFTQAVIKYEINRGFVYKEDLNTSHALSSSKPSH